MVRALNNQASGPTQTHKYLNTKDSQNLVFIYYVNGFNTRTPVLTKSL
jgi:hypothetical protein